MAYLKGDGAPKTTKPRKPLTKKQTTARLDKADRSRAKINARLPKDRPTHEPVPTKAGEPGRGTRVVIHAPLKRKRASLKDLLGAGATNAGRAPMSAGLATVTPPTAAADRSASLGTKLARTAAHTAAATVEATARDPIKQAQLDTKQAKDVLRGIIALPGAIYTSGKELATEGESKTGGKLVTGVGKHFSKSYGPAFRGDKGAYGTQLRRQRKDGSFYEMLDLGTVGLGAGAATTGVAKGVAAAQKAAGKTGTRAQRAVAATKHRAPLRESAGHVAPQRARRTLPGAAASTTKDATRKAVQRRAVKRAAAGGKPLSERRAAALPGEVVGASERLAARRARKRVAQDTRIERQTADGRVRRELTGRKGGRDHPDAKTTRSNMDSLPSDAHRTAAIIAHRYGIRSAKGAAAVLSRRIAQIEKERGGAPLTAGERASGGDELAALKALRENPGIFGDPAVLRTADFEAARATRVSGPETGLAPERHLVAKYQPQADTLGVSRHTKDATTLDYAKRIGPDLGVYAPTDAAIVALARQKGITRQAAALEANQRFMRDVSRANRAAVAAGAPHMARRTTAEPATEYVARVRAEAAKHELVDPGYVPSRSNAVDAGRERQGVSGTPDPPAGSFGKREGEVFRRGLERADAELLVSKLGSTIRQGTRLKAETAMLEREGKQFPNRDAAVEWLQANHVDPASRELVNSPVVREGSAPASGPARGDYVPTKTTYVVPSSVLKEWDAQHGAPNIVERGAARLQSNTQAVMLGSSTSWFQFQILADSITLGAAGGLHKLISANREYRQMDDAAREQVDVLVGGNPANDILIERAGDQLSAFSRIMATSPTYRNWVRGRRPLTALLRAEGARAAAFRRAGVAAKAARIDRAVVATRAPFARIQHALGKTDGTPGDLANALAHPQAAEAAAEHVNSIMGDFANYTAVERRALKSIIPFYGFMRYSVRMVLYTLPVNHPYVAVLLGELGKLGAEEAKDIVGPDLPYGLSAFYNADGTKAVDLQRASPVLNSLTASSTLGQLESGLLPPLAVLALNAGFGKNLYKGRDYKVGGSASTTPSTDLTPEDRARIFAHELLGFLAPVRAYEKGLPPQSDDTLPGSRRPIQSLDPKIANSFEDSAAERNKQSRWERFIHEMLPLMTPQQPTSNRAAGANATKKKRERAALRTKRDAKRDAILNDPLESLLFQEKQSRARQDDLLAPADDDLLSLLP